jgi:pantoate kinase
MPDGNTISDIPAAAVTRLTEIRGPAEARPERIPALLRPNPGTGPTPTLRAEDFSPSELREVATAFADVVGLVNRDLRIQIDESTGRVVTQIVDGETNEIVRQLPPEALLDVARRVADLVGLLLDEER